MPPDNGVVLLWSLGLGVLLLSAAERLKGLVLMGCKREFCPCLGGGFFGYCGCGFCRGVASSFRSGFTES